MKGKQVFIGIAALALIAVAYFAFDNSGSEEYVRGTIGAPDTVIAGVEQASRYRSEQITSDDVQLGDTELQQFLQSEIVQELISNPSFARAIQDQAVQRAMEQGWTEAMFETDETREALAAIPEDATGSYEIPVEDAMRDVPVDDASRDIPVDQEGNYKDIFNDEFVRSALEDDAVRTALLDEYVRELVGEEWFQDALDDQEVAAWLKDAAERERDREEFKTDESGREEFKTDESGREEFKTDESGREEFKTEGLDGEEFKTEGFEGEEFKSEGFEGEEFKSEGFEGEEFKSEGFEGEEFKAISEDAEQFKAALEANPALKKAVFEHAEVFGKAATDPEFGKALQRTAGDFEKMEQAFGKAVIGNRTLAFALAEDPETFMKAVQLAKIPELQKMDDGMRRAILTNKSVQDAVFARTAEFGKANEGF